MAASDYKEYLLKTTTFKEPRIVIGKEAVATLLTRIILLEPGTNPLHPTMGVGIVSRYRFLYATDMATQLKNDITDQIRRFLPEYQFGGVEIIYNSDNTVDLQITIDDTIYLFDSSDTLPNSLTSIVNNNN